MTIAPPWQSWLRRLTTEPQTRTRLVCFPPAGSGASFFSGWRPPRGIELWAVQPPGREDRLHEPGLESVQATAARVVRALQWINDVPMAFFGQSLGAMIAYEASLSLVRQGMPGPVHLFASSCRAPSGHQRHLFNRWDEACIRDALHQLGLSARLLEDANLRALFLPAARYDLHMFFTYQPGTGQTVDCPITAMIGDTDPHVSVAHAADWRHHTTGPCQTTVFRGGHDYTENHREGIVAAVAESLSNSLIVADGHGDASGPVT